jgi:hypothetical protein
LKSPNSLLIVFVIVSAMLGLIGCHKEKEQPAGPIKPGVYRLNEAEIKASRPLTIGWNELDGKGTAVFVFLEGWREGLVEFRWGTGQVFDSVAGEQAFDFSEGAEQAVATTAGELNLSHSRLSGKFYWADGAEGIDKELTNVTTFDTGKRAELKAFVANLGLVSAL